MVIMYNSLSSTLITVACGANFHFIFLDFLPWQDYIKSYSDSHMTEFIIYHF